MLDGCDQTSARRRDTLDRGDDLGEAAKLRIIQTGMLAGCPALGSGAQLTRQWFSEVLQSSTEAGVVWAAVASQAHVPCGRFVGTMAIGSPLCWSACFKMVQESVGHSNGELAAAVFTTRTFSEVVELMDLDGADLSEVALEVSWQKAGGSYKPKRCMSRAPIPVRYHHRSEFAVSHRQPSSTPRPPSVERHLVV